MAVWYLPAVMAVALCIIGVAGYKMGKHVGRQDGARLQSRRLETVYYHCRQVDLLAERSVSPRSTGEQIAMHSACIRHTLEQLPSASDTATARVP